MSKKKYLINGFAIHFKNLEKYTNYNMEDFFPKSNRFDIITNFLYFFRLSISGKMKQYHIVHINTWENFLNFWNKKDQIFIWESHWFHFWLNFKDTLIHFKGIKKILAFIINILVEPLIKYRIKKFDIYYVSTPNMLEYAKLIRLDVKRLPNSVDTNIFTVDGKQANMIGDPVIFLPTRIHSFKNPKFWIELFLKIKKKYPGAVLHLIHYPNGGDYFYNYYRKELTNPDDYIWHNFKTKEELADMYRASDIVLGHFHPDLWMMSLVEIQAAACWTAVISYDKYEIKTSLDKLEEITFSILSDQNKYDRFVNTNRNIVLKNHSPENVAKILKKDINIITSNIYTRKITEPILKENITEILKIEAKKFNDIGVWKEENFINKYFNKFDTSFLLFKWNKVIGYIIGYSSEKYGYINRLAISNEETGQWLGDFLINCFNDNLKYTIGVKIVELVTHNSLSVGWFYRKNAFHSYDLDSDIEKFLNRKEKSCCRNDYIWENKNMTIYYKNLW